MSNISFVIQFNLFAPLFLLIFCRHLLSFLLVMVIINTVCILQKQLLFLSVKLFLGCGDNDIRCVCKNYILSYKLVFFTASASNQCCFNIYYILHFVICCVFQELSADYAVDSVDKSVSQAVGSAIDVVDVVEYEKA